LARSYFADVSPFLTCCVIGNYYSLSSRHEDAIIHFRRALILDRNFSSALTLLGHEYLKLQNTHAAIESYRHAVDLNNKDYRAFVGLDQAYEVLEKPTFSSYYYGRAVALRPGDMDLWIDGHLLNKHVQNFSGYRCPEEGYCLHYWEPFWI